LPSSRLEIIRPVVILMSTTNPKTLLDVGCGFGKFGFLAREYLGLWNAPDKEKHKLEQLDAIEAWEPYITEFQRLVYDRIIIGNICDLCDTIGTYDMILMAEVLEHLDKEDGYRVLRALRKKANKCLVVTTPKRVRENDAETEGVNPFETHRSQWQRSDFDYLECSDCSLDELGMHFIVTWK